MNLRSLWAGSVSEKAVSDALEYITKKINLVFGRQHVSSGVDAGLHTFPGTAVPYDPGLFGSETAGQTWAVTATDYLTYRYTNLGGWILLYGTFAGAVGGAAGNILTIRLPLGVRGPATRLGGSGWGTDAGVGQALFVGIQEGADVIRVGRSNLAVWTNGAIQVRFQLLWEQRPLA